MTNAIIGTKGQDIIEAMTESNTTIRSYYESQESILDGIQKLYCPDGFECDMTYGNGAFWKKRSQPRLKYDIDPQKPGVVKACSMMLPVDDASLKNCVFDPPFMTYVKNGRQHKDRGVSLTARFGGYYRYEELEEHYRGTISEAWRVLEPGGFLVFKCQDIIHNHKMHCTHFKVMLMADLEGFRLKDLFVLGAKHRMPGPQKGQQRHARIYHSYFLVFEKPGERCKANPPLLGAAG